MRNKLFYLFQNDLKERLRNPKFSKAWVESELDYQLARQLIKKRLEKKLSQRALARKAKTTQAVISRIETMNANPSLALLKRISEVLNTKLVVQLANRK